MSRKTLQLAPDLKLPLSFATEGVAVIGRRGSGKSNAQVRWAEACFDADVPFVGIDPKGDWYGIRSAGDGKGPGLPVPVFGGLYGDFPLNPAGPAAAQDLGARVADLLVDQMLSAVLDVSLLSHNARSFFLVGFFKSLMSHHQRGPHVRSVILEEAHRYIPQEVRGESAAVKEAAASVLLEGRSWGLGCWACTQRPARLHKDVLEEVANLLLFSLGVAARNDINAVQHWFRYNDLAGEILPTLRGRMQPGEAWAVFPEIGEPKRVRIDRRRTFDSGATPAVGATSRKPATMADIDVPAITAAMEAEIERARENDPGQLKGRVRALEAKVRDAAAQAKRDEEERDGLVEELAGLYAERDELLSRVVEVTEIEVPVFGDDHLAELKRIAAEVAGQAEAFTTATERMLAEVDRRMAAVHDRAPTPPPPPPQAGRERNAAPRAEQTARVRADRDTALGPGVQDGRERAAAERRAAAAEEASGVRLGKTERAVLNVLVQKPGSTWVQVAFLVGGHPKTKSLTNARGALRSAGLIVGSNETMYVTTEGRAAAGPGEPLGDPLQFWLERLGHVERCALQELANAWPDRLASEELAARIPPARGDGQGYHPKTKTYTNALGRLRGLGLIEGERSAMKAVDELMEG